MSNVLIHREIRIDAGHRVPDHGSKCFNIHGHGWRIIATCSGSVIDVSGNEENGMVIDFGNIKKYMMDILDAMFDHGFVVYKGDKLLMNMFFPNMDHEKVYADFAGNLGYELVNYVSMIKNGNETRSIRIKKSLITEENPKGQKLIITNYVPTAENMARHMFSLLKRAIEAHYNNEVKLVNIRLYETPNGYVDWPGIQSYAMLS